MANQIVFFEMLIYNLPVICMRTENLIKLFLLMVYDSLLTIFWV